MRSLPQCFYVKITTIHQDPSWVRKSLVGVYGELKNHNAKYQDFNLEDCGDLRKKKSSAYKAKFVRFVKESEPLEEEEDEDFGLDDNDVSLLIRTFKKVLRKGNKKKTFGRSSSYGKDLLFYVWKIGRAHV